ncbi:hypothetical protein BS47DRAFT_1369591 [Hydnum rufescens UP504]|uniref:Uncharacterized protein n=1 Tax=Hydnum rufescens UP504 TaxID=1448309 RepID=A0A9P6ACU5_9AGAM|nr:hypothetical protein BS47DRAFT_1369591 [Hydnum rufescens UP504]
MPQEPYTRCGGCMALFNVTIRTNTPTSPNRNRAKWKPNQHPTELTKQRTDPNQTPAMAGVWFYVMAWSQDASDGDGLIEQAQRPTPNNTTAITPTEPHPLRRVWFYISHKRALPKERAQTKPRTRMHDTRTMEPPDKHTPASAVSRLTSPRPTTPNPPEPIRKPDRGRHATVVRASTTPARAGVILQGSELKAERRPTPYTQPKSKLRDRDAKKNEYYTPASAGVIIFNFKVFF